MTDNKKNLHNLLILSRAHITTRLHWKLTKQAGLTNLFVPGWQSTFSSATMQGSIHPGDSLRLLIFQVLKQYNQNEKQQLV